MTRFFLEMLVSEGKLEDITKVYAPGSETVPNPRDDEAVVFVAFLDAGLWIPCVDLVTEVMWLYGVELA